MKETLKDLYEILGKEIMIMQAHQSPTISNTMGTALIKIIDAWGKTTDKTTGRRKDTYITWDDIKSNIIFFMIYDPKIYLSLDLSKNWIGYITNRINLGFMRSFQNHKDSKRYYNYNISLIANELADKEVTLSYLLPDDNECDEEGP